LLEWRRIYFLRSILLSNSERNAELGRSEAFMRIVLYFLQDVPTIKQVTPHSEFHSLTGAVFESRFAEGDGGRIQCNCDPRAIQYISARTIESIEDFELLHSVVYYLYTDKVCFTTAVVGEEQGEIPECDAEAAYAIADRFQLEGLKAKARAFLLDTCCIINIVPRILGEFAFEYEELGRSYENIFFRLWDQVRDTDKLSKFLLSLEESDDRGKASRANQRVWELMKGLRSP
jgi:hypothetical protein